MRLLEGQENLLDSLPESEKKKERDKFTHLIVRSRHKKQVVISGAGTGKSTLFKKKVVFWQKQGVSADKILVLSFINFIVDTLQRDLPNCKVFTLHKFAKLLIHKFLGLGKNLKHCLTNNFTVALTNCDESNIVQDILWLLEERGLNQQQTKKVIDDYFKSRVIEDIDQEILEKYFELTTFYNCVTFDDSIFRAIEILEKIPEILDFEKCLVDEYQDFNPGEQALVNLIFEILDGGIITGDDDQSIYSGRKADPAGIRNLVANKAWEKGVLPFCSRTRSSAIVKASIIIARRQTDKFRIDKTYLPLEDNANKIYIVPLSQSRFSEKDPKRNFLIEAEFILRVIDKKRIESWTGGDPEYLILCRTRHHSTLIANALNNRGLQFEIKKPDVFSDQSVQLLFSYLQLLMNDRNNLAYRRLLGLNGLNLDEQKDLFLRAYQKGFHSLNDKTIIRIKKILVELQTIVKKAGTPEQKLEIVLQYLRLNVNTSSPLKEFIDFLKQSRTFAALLNKTEDLIIEERERERKAILSNPIHCLTIQSSKGLSAKSVFVLGLECGYLPKGREPTDEEIRLMYVAMTRSREDLYLLTCKSRADGVHEKLGSSANGIGRFVKQMSILIDWIPENYKEYLKEFKKEDF